MEDIFFLKKIFMCNKVLIFIFIFFSTTACAATFTGKVIDADTKEPIEGAVAVVSWNEARATIAGEDTRLKDVKETLTDKNGKWMIEGHRGRWGGNITAIFTFLTGTYYTRPPEFIIFKPGYCSWPKGFSIEACQGKIKPDGNDKVAKGEIVELPKLTKREDRLRALPGRVTGYLTGEDAWKKQKEFTMMLNEERRNLGLEEY